MCARNYFFFNSPPVGGSPAAPAPSGTALGAAEAALCANERRDAMRGVCRRRRVLANMERELEGREKSKLFVSAY